MYLLETADICQCGVQKLQIFSTALKYSYHLSLQEDI